MSARCGDCTGCYMRGDCDSLVCSECGETGDVVLETTDIKDRGGPYRPCADCRELPRKASQYGDALNEELRRAAR